VAAERDVYDNQLQPPCRERERERELGALATRQHGVVAIAQLHRLGLDGKLVRRRELAGRLHRVHRGVYAVGHAALAVDGRRMAAVLACGEGALLSHRSAAAAWGLRPTSGTAWEVTTAQRGRRSPAGIELHATRALAPADATTLRGVPITSVSRTLVDLAAVVPHHALERAVHEAEVLRLLDVTAVRAALARANGRRGAGRLRAILAEPPAGPTRSVLEERFLRLCRSGLLPVPRLNVHVMAGGTLVEVDALWQQPRVIVELDGAGAHHTRRAFHADRRRDAALAAEGYVVVRFTWQRVTRERAAVLAELRRILTLRGGCS
jgi:very-short-patch-repair endonuclease